MNEDRFDGFRICKFSPMEQTVRTISVIRDYIIPNYPKFDTWAVTKLLPDLTKHNNRRIIYFTERDSNIGRDSMGKIVGVGIVVSNANESKISTLVVLDDYRRKGVGTKLMEGCLQILESSKNDVFIYVPHSKIKDFHNFLDNYGFSVDEEYVNNVDVKYVRTRR